MNNLKYWNAGVTGIRAEEISSSHREREREQLIRVT